MYFGILIFFLGREFFINVTVEMRRPTWRSTENNLIPTDGRLELPVAQGRPTDE
jgi:hypothetical protein